MAFYFRKLSPAIRLVPATKSLGYSTYSSEGDKAKENDSHSKKQTYANICVERQRASDNGSLMLSPLPSPCGLVPLSVRDMATVLVPRLKEYETASPFDNLAQIMVSSKTISFTCDDILAEPYYDPRFRSSGSTNTVLERVTVNLQHSDCTNNKSVDKSDNVFHHLAPRPQWEVDERCTSLSEIVCGSDKNSETELTCDRLLSSFDVLLCSSGGHQKTERSSKDGHNVEQLHSVKDKLEKTIIFMFTSRYNYSLLHKDVVFENNMFGDNKVRRGLTLYALELLRVRLKVGISYSSATMEVLNTTVNEDSGVIRIHWRLKGLPQTEAFKFWRFFMTRDQISKDDWRWFEAFSYFHIGKDDGLVHKHRIDRMLPGDDQTDKLSVKLRKLLSPAKPLVS